MHKYGDERDSDRRYKHVSKLQDGDSWKKHRKLAPANETWPTALIIAPSSVVGNWEREFQKVCLIDRLLTYGRFLLHLTQWGYFEVGNYSGSDKDYVLKNFNMGRLDVCESLLRFFLESNTLTYPLCSVDVVRDRASRHRVTL